VERSARLHPLCFYPEISHSPQSCFRVLAGVVTLHASLERTTVRSPSRSVKSKDPIERSMDTATRHMVAHVTAELAEHATKQMLGTPGHTRTWTRVKGTRERETNYERNHNRCTHAPRGLTIGLPPPHLHLLPPILWSPLMHASRHMPTACLRDKPLGASILSSSLLPIRPPALPPSLPPSAPSPKSRKPESKKRLWLAVPRAKGPSRGLRSDGSIVPSSCSPPDEARGSRGRGRGGRERRV